MTNISKFTLLATCLLLLNAAMAQSESFDRFSNARQMEDQLEAKNTQRVRAGTAYAEIKIAKPDGYPAKDIPQGFEGFRIEILLADSLLAPDHTIFFRHGNIMLESLSDGRFAYTIGDFNEEATATSFMQQFILPTYKEARVVRYQNGKRN